MGRYLRVKRKRQGAKALLELDTVVSPDTLMRWHWRLVAQKWDFSKRRDPMDGRGLVTHYLLFVMSR